MSVRSWIGALRSRRSMRRTQRRRACPWPSRSPRSRFPNGWPSRSRVSREERSILVRDSNKIVALAALSSPKITEVEVEAIARMPNVSDEILRIIGRTRAWVKNYRIAVALIKNPKTPVALSMRLLPRLTEKDLKMLSTDRNVADVVRTTARRKVVFAK